MSSSVWVFLGDSARFPSGVFSTLGNAKDWILDNKLNGLLTEYPVDKGVYEWSVDNDYFIPKKPQHFESQFIAQFTTASQEHHRFEGGVEL